MCVHTSHCCRIHQCKYGDPDCPVYLVEKAQEYPCELCMDAGWENTKDIPKIPVKEIIQRREEGYAQICPFDEW